MYVCSVCIGVRACVCVACVCERESVCVRARARARPRAHARVCVCLYYDCVYDDVWCGGGVCMCVCARACVRVCVCAKPSMKGLTVSSTKPDSALSASSTTACALFTAFKACFSCCTAVVYSFLASRCLQRGERMGIGRCGWSDCKHTGSIVLCWSTLTSGAIHHPFALQHPCAYQPQAP